MRALQRLQERIKQKGLPPRNRPGTPAAACCPGRFCFLLPVYSSSEKVFCMVRNKTHVPG